MKNRGIYKRGMTDFQLRYFAVVCLLFVGFSLFAENKEDYFLTVDISKPSAYEREANYLTVTLHSRNPEIVYANVVETPSVKGGSFSYINRIDSHSRGSREIIDGKEYFAYPLQTYLFTLHDKGNYKIVGGSYEIGVSIPVVYDDPFWGRTRGVQTKNISLKADQTAIKVKKIPTPASEDHFCDVVGEFEISTVIPPGDVIINEPSVAVITIKGKGLLGNDILPEYSSAFRDEVKLKSMSENRRMYFDGKDIISELQLECEFIPLSAKAKIGSLKMVYFNPSTGKYETAESSPVNVDVKSITTKVETIDI